LPCLCFQPTFTGKNSFEGCVWKDFNDLCVRQSGCDIRFVSQTWDRGEVLISWCTHHASVDRQMDLCPLDRNRKHDITQTFLEMGLPSWISLASRIPSEGSEEFELSYSGTVSSEIRQDVARIDQRHYPTLSRAWIDHAPASHYTIETLQSDDHWIWKSDLALPHHSFPSSRHYRPRKMTLDQAEQNG
jgi:hypothetical protein